MVWPRHLRRCLFACILAASLGAVRAEIVIGEANGKAEDRYYAHPTLRSLVFVSPETRSQAILPPSPVFVPAAPLIFRAPGSPLLPYPPQTPLAFNRSGTPTNRDIAIYSLERAHAFSQNLYRRNGVTFAHPGSVSPFLWASPYVYGWILTPYPPTAQGSSHPSNRDNAIYNIERAHRFSQDAYRQP